MPNPLSAEAMGELRARLQSRLNEYDTPDWIKADYRDVLAALATPPAVPSEGWKLVPVEPTEAMIEAVAFLLPRIAKEYWSAMLAAAPNPAQPAASDGGGKPKKTIALDVALEAVRDRRDNGGGSASYKQACNHIVEALSILATQPATPEPAGEGEVLATGQFLLDRIDGLEWSDDGYTDLLRDWNGHVDPALARFRAALQRASGQKGAEA